MRSTRSGDGRRRRTAIARHGAPAPVRCGAGRYRRSAGLDRKAVRCAGATRYAALLATALADLAADPARPTSAARPELGAGVRSYHLRHSRRRVRTDDSPVGRPRHVVLYRTDPAGTVEVGRIL